MQNGAAPDYGLVFLCLFDYPPYFFQISSDDKNDDYCKTSCFLLAISPINTTDIPILLKVLDSRAKVPEKDLRF